jgi:hypothetical protein
MACPEGKDSNMSSKKKIAAGIVVIAALFGQAVSMDADAALSGLKLHLPREITVKENVILLGDIAVASGEEGLVQKAENIPLGTISLANQKVVIDRYTIMTRLGSSGVNVSQVTLTGAEKVTVALVRRSISSAELLVEAEKFAVRFPLPVDQRFHALDMPADVNLSDAGGKLEVVARLAGKPNDDPLIVSLLVTCDGRKAAVREVRFTPVPRSARPAAVAAATSTKPVVAEDAPKVVFRNQPVVIEIDVPGLKVTAMGLPLEDGRAGQFIKVRNIDSKRDIVAKVKADGTVSPVL